MLRFYSFIQIIKIKLKRFSNLRFEYTNLLFEKLVRSIGFLYIITIFLLLNITVLIQQNKNNSIIYISQL